MKAKLIIEEAVSNWFSRVIEPLEDECGFELRAKNIQPLYDFCEVALENAQKEAIEKTLDMVFEVTGSRPVLADKVLEVLKEIK